MAAPAALIAAPLVEKGGRAVAQALSLPVIGATHDVSYVHGKGAKARTVTDHYSFQLRGWEMLVGGLGLYVAWQLFQNPPWGFAGNNPASGSIQGAVDQGQAALDQALKDGKITQAQYDAAKAKLETAQKLADAARNGPIGLIQGLSILSNPFAWVPGL